MKKIALLICLAAIYGPRASVVAALDPAALPLMEIPANNDKDKEKRAKKDEKEEGKVPGSPASTSAIKSCCAKPSRMTAMGAKPPVKVNK